ncbi:MAG: citryl-CoA lyase [Candidatus Uhrbacteria bacterium]
MAHHTISSVQNGELFVRGETLTSLIASSSFLDGVFLLLRGDRPSESERAMLDAMLMACCEHGADPPSTAAVRVSISTGNELHAALAAGLLAMGSKHGCAVSDAMLHFSRAITSDVFVCDMITSGRRIPGFGHKVYTESDPRTIALLARARTLQYHGKHVTYALAVENELAIQKGRRLPLNIDGILAALLLELRFPVEVGNAVFIMGRLPGLIAHAHATMCETTYLRASTHGSDNVCE